MNKAAKITGLNVHYCCRRSTEVFLSLRVEVLSILASPRQDGTPTASDSLGLCLGSGGCVGLACEDKQDEGGRACGCFSAPDVVCVFLSID